MKKIILTNFHIKYRRTNSLHGIHCLHFESLMVWKIRMMYSEVKIVYKTIKEVSNVSQAMKLINFEKKKILTLKYKQQETQEKAKKFLCLKKALYKYTKVKIYHKFRDHCHYTTK